MGRAFLSASFIAFHAADRNVCPTKHGVGRLPTAARDASQVPPLPADQRVVAPREFRLGLGPKPHADHRPAPQPLDQRGQTTRPANVAVQIEERRLFARLQKSAERRRHLDRRHGRTNPQPLQLELNQIEQPFCVGRWLKQTDRKRVSGTRCVPDIYGDPFPVAAAEASAWYFLDDRWKVPPRLLVGSHHDFNS